MSGDLISKDVLLEDIRNSITECSGIMDWLKLIDRQPTAYDVDKVVEQLEEKASEHAENGHQYGADGWYNHASKEYAKRDGYYEAIEIVKAGGVE